jgi:hypothetical protein
MMQSVLEWDPEDEETLMGGGGPISCSGKGGKISRQQGARGVGQIERDITGSCEDPDYLPWNYIPSPLGRLTRTPMQKLFLIYHTVYLHYHCY